MTNNPLNILLEKNILTGPNYVDWLRNLRIILNLERIRYILEADIPTEPSPEACKEEKDIYLKWLDDDLRVRSYMLASMSNDLQSSHEKMSDARSVLLHLQELYGEHSRTARYEISRELFRAKMSEGG
ncbi:Retrotransposon Copia-like N-terminal protein [Dioscorea alata]|uniref:Retrotransposon Copia-like N-terminal protein n=1 Tax=Dioscorea alata TaxID=55571 RepID=A0ACB7WPT7_DIOAL|nr:Retrotransposon Copia-like N-terminal protein [Dioscorea alata]